MNGAAKIYETRDLRVVANTDIDVGNASISKNFPFNVDTATRSKLIAPSTDLSRLDSRRGTGVRSIDPV